jgi:hypothetical protein
VTKATLTQDEIMEALTSLSKRIADAIEWTYRRPGKTGLGVVQRDTIPPPPVFIYCLRGKEGIERAEVELLLSVLGEMKRTKRGGSSRAR